MKLFLTTLLIICFHFSLGQTNEAPPKVYYPSGKVKTEWVFDTGCHCEKTIAYYESGAIMSTNTIHLGKEDMANYSEDGTLLMSNHWKNNALDGRSYNNYRNGKLAFEKFYAGSFKTGRWTFYLEDGNINYTETFEEGKTRWDSNDDYSTVKYYLEGKPAYTATFIAGRKDKVTVHDESLYKQLLVLQAPTGQKLFRQYCNSCHLPETDLVGPMMKGVAQKRSDEWLTKMIRNGDALVQSGDKKAVALYKEWKNLVHPNFEMLTDEEIKLIIEYLKTMK